MVRAVCARVLVAALTLVLTAAAAAHPGQPEPPVLEVEGHGVVTAPPDTVSVRLGARFIEPTVAEAQAKANEAVAGTIAALKAAGLPAACLRTSGLSISPIYERLERGDDREPRLLGYEASNIVAVRLDDVTTAGAMVDAGLKAGANELDDITFGLKEPAPRRVEALRRAVADARLTAETIAEAMGVRIVGVAEISDASGYRGGGGQSPFTGVAHDGDTPIEPGLVGVKAEVSVRFLIAPK